MELDSLLGQVFKARYYPTRSFMEATTGSWPSATWRSILAARPFVERGSRVRIGNGYSTAIWESDWIPENGNFKVITPRPQSFYPVKVADLIDPISGTWDVGMINSTFWEVDRGRILAIPLGSVMADDKTVWHYSKNGRFSVRSCYHFISSVMSNQGASGQGATSGVGNLNWKEIWNLPIPPKIRVFLWRACSGILPHKAELFRRHICSNPFCSSCDVEVETIGHVLMDCRGMREFWQQQPFNLPGLERHTSMWSIYQLLKMRLQSDLFLVSLVICWKVWEVRNLETHGDSRGFPSDVLRWSSEYLRSYQEAQATSSISHTPPFQATWAPPDRGKIKINVDVGFPGNLAVFHTSLVARDNSGRCVGWRRQVINGRPSPTDGEAVAILHGMQEAVARNWRNVIIETDCLSVHRLLCRGSSSLVSYGAVLDSCFALIPSFHSLSFSFVKRSGNCVAHALATALNLVCNEGVSLPSDLKV